MATDANVERERSLRQRITDNPTPAVIWLVGIALLLVVEVGAIINLVSDANVPTLLSRSIFDNSGWHTASGGWKGTFLNLSPAIVWAIRVVLTYAYALLWLFWVWQGYNTYRRHYRYADWSPRDDMVNRFRNHTWGVFGFIVVFSFLVMSIFAPALGTTTIDQTFNDPYSHHTKYFDKESGTVKEVTIGVANHGSASKGNPDVNVGMGSYDDYDRWHPLGTLPSGKDMFTFMVHGARVSLFIGVTAVGLGAILAVAIALLTAYYKGLLDLLVVVVGDSVMSLPRFMIVLLLGDLLRGTWIMNIYNGALMFGLLFAATGWPFLWRAIRGPAFQISEQEWIDAARSFGQTPRVTMQKHMAPYILGYLLVYASMTFGGVIVSVAGLSFLGVGIQSPTPEWGRAVAMGQQYVTGASWHISIIPGLFIVIIVTGFNALGDGIRDAIDPQSKSSEDSGAEVAAASGGGA